MFRILLVLCLFSALTARADIQHLELGAANHEAEDGNHELRFRVLFETVASLISTYGANGVIYLNDISVGGLDLAAAELRAHLEKLGHSRIRVEKLPGDYHKIDLPKVRTANLSHPTRHQLPDDSGQAAENDVIVRALEKIAANSQTGLKIMSYYNDTGIGKNRMGFLGARLRSSKLIELNETGIPYRYADGGDPAQWDRSLTTRKLKVYRLVSLASCEGKAG